MIGHHPHCAQKIVSKTRLIYIFRLYCVHKAVVSLLMYVSPSRQEYRPWTGVRPAKSARRNPPALYSSPGTEATHVPRETSYQAAYNWEAERSTELLQGENIILSASSSIQPAAVHQPIPTALQAGSAISSSGLQHSVLTEKTELSGMTKGEVGIEAMSLTIFKHSAGRTTGLTCPVLLFKAIFTHLPGGLLLLGHLRKVIQHSVPKQLKVTQLFKTGHVLC